MKIKWFAGILGLGIMIVPSGLSAERKTAETNSGVQRAIAFERYKEAAAARQARIEARANRNNNADRSMDDSVTPKKKSPRAKTQ